MRNIFLYENVSEIIELVWNYVRDRIGLCLKARL